MFQQMINGSIAVLTRPSASTFEEHEQNNLGWALIYSLIAGVINAVISWIGSLLFPPEIPGLEPGVAASQATDIFFLLPATLLGTVIFLLIYWGIVYLLGRAFGGTGEFGELAYGFALFSAPLTVIGSLVSNIPVVGAFLSLAVSIYGLYLTYLAIQSGMNLPANKALYVVLILFAIGLAIVLCVALFFATLIAAFIGASGGFSP
ncbi:MAG: Yip1 family protein [Oscillochloridaceae bacterium]|nr:YIP1 family protein [Chloroflexaceae bacterium]MDW8388878.1 Yip1 family protein [Oscillochloridaceae bacterium]